MTTTVILWFRRDLRLATTRRWSRRAAPARRASCPCSCSTTPLRGPSGANRRGLPVGCLGPSTTSIGGHLVVRAGARRPWCRRGRGGRGHGGRRAPRTSAPTAAARRRRWSRALAATVGRSSGSARPTRSPGHVSPDRRARSRCSRRSRGPGAPTAGRRRCERPAAISWADRRGVRGLPDAPHGRRPRCPPPGRRPPSARRAAFREQAPRRTTPTDRDRPASTPRPACRRT